MESPTPDGELPPLTTAGKPRKARPPLNHPVTGKPLALPYSKYWERKKREEMEAVAQGLKVFLNPELPKEMLPAEMEALKPAEVKRRFLQAYNASMGNLSLALHFVGRTRRRLNLMLKRDKKFALKFADMDATIKDRSILHLHSCVGLVTALGPVSTRSGVISEATLLRAVVMLTEKSVQTDEKVKEEVGEEEDAMSLLPGIARPKRTPDAGLPANPEAK